MKISEGLREGGIVVGNNYNKYSTQNPIARRLMRGFSESLSALVSKAAPETIHEVGCGEGYWTLAWHQQGMQVKGSDFSEQVIALAKENAAEQGLPSALFSRRSIYELAQGDDSADLIVCCEVLEHLDDPEAGLAALRRVATRNIILSVPREPLWCALNLARGKYWSSLGNTPGHIQHWSSRAFVDLVQKYFEVQEIRKPLPWTILLCKKY